MSYPLGCVFAGVGRFEAGLAAAGWEAAWQIEAKPFRRRVLERRFGVDVLPDVREASGLPKVRGLCGGFPCQDLSAAGPRVGIHGARSSLWGQFDRIIGELEPEVVFIENVPPLLYRGFDLVVADLVEMGYSVEWDCIPAAAVGAPHLRDRVWIVAERGGTEPGIFGPPAAIFPMAPTPASEGWRRWPRAGFAVDPNEALSLQPLAPISRLGSFSIPGTNGGVAKAPFPTPSATPYGSSQNEGGVDHDRPSRGTPSLETMARRGEWRVEWPTPHGLPKDGQARRPGPSGNKLGNAVNNEARGLWPTPTVSDSKGATPNLQRDGSPNLAERVEEVGEELWPTPSASDGSGGRNEIGAVDRAIEEGQDGLRTLSRPSGAKAALSLRTAAVAAERGLWPTPRASGDHDSGGGEMTTYRRTPSQAEGKHGLYLQVEACEAHLEEGGDPFWEERSNVPTPRASDGDPRNRGDLIAHAKDRPNSHHPGERAEGRENERQAGALNPPWVEWLMGMPCGWTDPELANEDLLDLPWSEEPLPRVADNVPGRNERLAACGDSLVAEIPARVASARQMR